MARNVGTGGVIFGGIAVAGIAWYYFSKHPATFSKLGQALNMITENRSKPNALSTRATGSAMEDPGGIGQQIAQLYHTFTPFELKPLPPG